MLRKQLLLGFNLFCVHVLFGQIWHNIEQNPQFDEPDCTVGTIDVIDENVVWVSKQKMNGNIQDLIVSVTFDGGNNWHPKSFQDDAEYWGISHFDAIDAQNAWTLMYNLSGLGAKCYRTQDAGNTWVNYCPYSSESFPNVIHFFNEEEGFTLGDPVDNIFEVYTTNNKGQTWSVVPPSNLPSPLQSEYGLAGSIGTYQHTIFCGTTKSRILKSSDKGVSWMAIDLSNTIGADKNITHIAMQNDLIAMIIFKNTNNGLNGIAYTNDGGNSWNITTPLGQYTGGLCSRNDIAYVPNTNRFFVTSAFGQCRGSAYTDDYGNNWTRVDSLNHFRTAWYNIQKGWSGSISQLVNGQIEGGVFRWVDTTSAVGNTLHSPDFVLAGKPNPTSDFYELSIHKELYRMPITWKLMNLQGQEIKSSHYPSFSGYFKENINLQAIEKGLYLLKIDIDRQSYILKVLKY